MNTHKENNKKVELFEGCSHLAFTISSTIIWILISALSGRFRPDDDTPKRPKQLSTYVVKNGSRIEPKNLLISRWVVLQPQSLVCQIIHQLGDLTSRNQSRNSLCNLSNGMGLFVFISCKTWLTSYRNQFGPYREVPECLKLHYISIISSNASIKCTSQSSFITHKKCIVLIPPRLSDITTYHYY